MSPPPQGRDGAGGTANRLHVQPGAAAPRPRHEDAAGAYTLHINMHLCICVLLCYLCQYPSDAPYNLTGNLSSNPLSIRPIHTHPLPPRRGSGRPCSGSCWSGAAAGWPGSRARGASRTRWVRGPRCIASALDSSPHTHSDNTHSHTHSYTHSHSPTPFVSPTLPPFPSRPPFPTPPPTTRGPTPAGGTDGSRGQAVAPSRAVASRGMSLQHLVRK